MSGSSLSTLNGMLKASQVARAYPELRCTFGGRSLVPDISVFRWERIPRRADGRVENIFNIAPDWAIEILSPNQGQTKVVRNLLHCLSQGSEMGWLLDPEESCIFVYDAARVVRVFDDAETVLPVPEFAAAVQLTAGEIFDWLKA
ncbi:Uma2 family endonuclease [Baaleninema simplex]|uniref:Uma2 family endonuclease n=1 Tax=Baaleninema simplex TaxID=2862350 RepID=UPI00036BAE70|nr:Uma2 family endonuclease [Baaleninema simplex]